MPELILPQLRHDLQKAILDLSLLEGQAAVMARHLSKSPLLTQEERDFAGDRLCLDESIHMQWTRKVASFLGEYDLDNLKKRLNGEIERLRADWTDLPIYAEDRRLVTRINFDERFFSHTIRKFRFVIDQLLPADLAAGAGRIESDEVFHKAWGCGILKRLRQEHADWKPEIRRYETIRRYPAEKIARQFQVLYRALAADEHDRELPSYAARPDHHGEH